MLTTLTMPSIKNRTRAFANCWMSFRLTSKETNGLLSVIDIRVSAGGEAPRHSNKAEDKTFLIHDGTACFFIGNEIIQANKGDAVFICRNTPHHFVVSSAIMHCTLIVTPGGLENFFNEIAIPFNHDFMPALEIPPSQEKLTMYATATEKYGMRFTL